MNVRDILAFAVLPLAVRAAVGRLAGAYVTLARRPFALCLSTAFLVATPALGDPPEGRRRDAAEDASNEGVDIESTPQAMVQPSPPRSVFVHLEANRPVDLFEEESDRSDMNDDAPEGKPSHRPGTRLVHVCSAPCDQWVPSNGRYLVDGESVRRSRPFLLIGRPGDRVVVTVNTAPASAFAGGIVLGAISLSMMTVGLMLFSAAANVDSIPAKPSSPWVPVGASLAVVGAVGTAVGVVMLVRNVRSSTSQSVDGSGRAQGKAGPTARWSLEPRGVWSDGAGSAWPTSPAFLTIPVCSGSF